MNKVTKIGVALASMLFLSATAASAVTFEALLTDDRGIQGSEAGGPTGLEIQNDGFLRVFGPSSIWRSGIEFDLTGLTTSSIVSSAILSLRDEGSSIDGDINVFGYSGDGVIALGDALNTGNQISSFTITQVNGSEDFSLDITAFIQSLATTGAGFAGVLLASIDETNFNIGGSDICSSEASNGTATFVRPNCVGFGPTLSITTTDVAPVPLPASLVLLLTATGTLGFVGRRRRT